MTKDRFCCNKSELKENWKFKQQTTFKGVEVLPK